MFCQRSLISTASIKLQFFHMTLNRRIQFFFPFFLLFAAPLFAMSSDEEWDIPQEVEGPPLFAPIKKSYVDDKMNPKGSVRLKKIASHFTPSRFAKKRRSVADYDNTYQILKAE